MSPGEEDAIKTLLRLAALGGLGGAAAGFGAGALRAANPRYVPPEAAAPVIVDMPVPAREAGPVSSVPIPSKTKPVAAIASKTATVGEWLSGQAKGLGDSIAGLMPTVHHPLGPTGAQTASDIPLTAALGIPAVAGGVAGGYMLSDRLARAAERRRAQAELDEARKEYQDAVTARTANLYFPKAASGIADLLADRTPTDPDLARTKAALDAAWYKQAGDPAPGDPTRGASGLSQAAMGWAWPGLLHKDTAPLQMGLLGALGTMGGIAGYRFARNDDDALAIRRETEKRDRANAAKIPAPVIARLVPVPTE